MILRDIKRAAFGCAASLLLCIATRALAAETTLDSKRSQMQIVATSPFGSCGVSHPELTGTLKYRGTDKPIPESIIPESIIVQWDGDISSALKDPACQALLPLLEGFGVSTKSRPVLFQSTKITPKKHSTYGIEGTLTHGKQKYRATAGTELKLDKYGAKTFKLGRKEKLALGNISNVPFEIALEVEALLVFK